VDESNLARLADTFAVGESLGPEQLGALQYIVKESTIEEEATATCPRSSLARVAMDHYNIFRVFFEVFIHFIRH